MVVLGRFHAEVNGIAVRAGIITYFPSWGTGNGEREGDLLKLLNPDGKWLCSLLLSRRYAFHVAKRNGMAVRLTPTTH